jgi:DNA-binding NtrC family response regulator
MASAAPVLVASPDEGFRAEMLAKLALLEWEGAFVSGGAEALAALHEGCEVVLLDSRIADLNVEELQALVKRQFPLVDVVIVDGTFAEVPKAPDRTQHARTRQLLQGFVRSDEKQPVKKALVISGSLGAHWVAAHASMKHLEVLIRMLAPRKTSVLIQGETGTGKELVARALHELGLRKEQPFVAVNCAAIPETLLESELFGYKRGAFTGATTDKQGRFHAADGGTLFLDEIGEMPLSVQAKLLRFLQEGEVQRLGDTKVAKVDVRVVSATNVDLQNPPAEKPFRKDLYFRLATFPMKVPALRERVSDVGLLARHFLGVLCDASQSRGFTDEALLTLERHDWPGNVRELQQVVERAWILSNDENPLIQHEHVAASLSMRHF